MGLTCSNILNISCSLHSLSICGVLMRPLSCLAGVQLPEVYRFRVQRVECKVSLLLVHDEPDKLPLSVGISSVVHAMHDGADGLLNDRPVASFPDGCSPTDRQ